MIVLAIVKCANRSGATVRGLINYVMDKDKVECIDVYGLDRENMAKESIIKQMNETKSIFDKQNGREVYHIIISFHKDEQITPSKANTLAMELYQCIPEFKDREAVFATQKHSKDGNIHTHIVINTVSFEDGSKLHTSRSWLQNLKDTNDDILRDNKLSVVEKGYDFHGDTIDRHEPWSMDAYMLKNEPSTLSWKDEIVKAVMETSTKAISKDDFISQLQKQDISCQWTDNRKHIVFSDFEGHKIRDTRIEKDYGFDAHKENLLEKFDENYADQIEIDDDFTDDSEITEREWLDDYYQESIDIDFD